MLQDGFYHTKLDGPFGKSEGIVVLEKNVLRGGDDMLVYEGSFGQSGASGDSVAIEADLAALIYSPKSNQKGEKFQVKCTGTGEGRVFKVTGKFATGEIVSVQGTFISRLEF